MARAASDGEGRRGMQAKAIPYDLPLSRPYRWAKGVQERRKGLLVRITMDGQVGWGETAPPPHEQDALHDLAGQAMGAAALLEGCGGAGEAGQRDTGVRMGPEGILDEANVAPRIRHGVLCAWLDTQAQAAGQPLGRFLAKRYDVGREPAPQVPVNALIEAAKPSEAAELARRAVAAGLRTLKVKSDGSRAGDVARLGAIRDAVGGGPTLRLDANESWRPDEAIARMEEVAPFGVAYVEQPIRAGRVRELIALMRATPVPVALDESVSSFAAVQPFLDAGCQPILILKPQRLGGPDRTVATMLQARQAGLACVVTNSLETAIGRAHALHLASLLEEPLPDCGLATEGHFAADSAVGVPTRSGWQRVPTRPGLGVAPPTHAAHLE